MKSALLCLLGSLMPIAIGNKHLNNFSHPSLLSPLYRLAAARLSLPSFTGNASRVPQPPIPSRLRLCLGVVRRPSATSSCCFWHFRFLRPLPHSTCPRYVPLHITTAPRLPGRALMPQPPTDSGSHIDSQIPLCSLVVGFPVRTVNAVEPVSLAALGTLDALGLAFLAVCAGPPRLGLCCQG